MVVARVKMLTRDPVVLQAAPPGRWLSALARIRQRERVVHATKGRESQLTSLDRRHGLLRTLA